MTFDGAARKVVLHPKANLQRGATYKVVIASGVRDAAGNPLDQNSGKAGNQPKSWTFQVRS